MAHVYIHDQMEFLRDLCRALGIDPDVRHVRSITLKSPVNDVVTVETVELLDKEQGERLLEVLRRYRVTVHVPPLSEEHASQRPEPERRPGVYRRNNDAGDPPRA